MAKAKRRAAVAAQARPIDRLDPAARTKVRANVKRFIAYAQRRRRFIDASTLPRDCEYELEFLPGELNR